MFLHRSYKPELLDNPNIPFADIKQNMRELDTINTLLGGHKITLKGIAHLLHQNREKSPVHIVEIGCGDGNNLRVIKAWAKKKNRAVRLTGIDYNKACIDYAKQIKANSGMQFICTDYRAAQLDILPDVIFSSLFCHHFNDQDLAAQLKWMQAQSRIGFFINDLHRHPFAYYSIKWLTQFFSRSYLVKHDAPLSVLRGFRKREWQDLLQRANVAATVQWKWAFRWLVVGAKENNQ